MVTVLKTETIEVPGGDPNNVQTKSKSLVPQKYSQPQTSGLTLTVTKDGKDDVLFELKDRSDPRYETQFMPCLPFPEIGAAAGLFV
ncbi:hypothetical protein GC197_16565 [bacterium]|nr:hypothetical protein [bacterium]